MHFARRMEQAMDANASRKNGWRDVSVQFASKRMMQEIAELFEAVHARTHDQVMEEAADVANFLMMLVIASGKQP